MSERTHKKSNWSSTTPQQDSALKLRRFTTKDDKDEEIQQSPDVNLSKFSLPTNSPFPDSNIQRQEIEGEKEEGEETPGAQLQSDKTTSEEPEEEIQAKSEEPNQEIDEPVQTKLTVGQPGDKYEQEADTVAAKVVEQINSPQTNQPVQGKVEPVVKPTVMRQGAAAGGAVNQDVEQNIQQARGSGQGLAENVRQPMEQAFGADFSGVKVHTDGQADVLNRSLNSRAFATGQDIFFKQGEYQPQSKQGQELLAHELTHVVQQGDGIQAKRSNHEILQCETSTGTVKTSEGTQEIEELKITGNPRVDFSSAVINGVKFASNRAIIKTLEYVQQVMSACDAFENYTEDRIEEIEGEVTGADLVKVLVSVPLTILAGNVGGRITSRVGQEIFKVITSEITGNIEDKAKEVATNKDDAKALRKAVTFIAQGVKDANTTLSDSVGEVLDPIVDSIIRKTNNNQPLSELENSLAQTFYQAETKVVDRELESFLGIPSTETAADIHVQLFKELVQKFEEKRIWLRSSFKEKLEMSFAQDFNATELTLKSRAGRLAKNAAKRRRQALKSNK